MSSLAEKESPVLETFGVEWPDSNGGLTYADTVKSNTSGSTLINFYSTKHSSSAPFQGWLQRIQNGQITIDGQIETNPDTIIRDGLELVYHRIPWKEPDAPYLLDVLYEDNHLVALNKPSGLQVLPGGLFQQRIVLTQLQWRGGKSGDQELHPVPVHRLGRGTSGILLCAKSKLAKTRLSAYFADGTAVVREKNTNTERSGRKISKIYRALATGIIDKDEVVICQPIGAMRYVGVAKGLYMASSSGKPALSKVKVLERDVQRNCTLVQVEIQSGRPHQIRIHLSFIGHPLAGDPLYASGGVPISFDSESVDDSHAKDGGYQRPARPLPGDWLFFVIQITAPLPYMLQSQEEANKVK
ncbi:hypothetical protein MKW94_028521 [Papaver nudicaule]|uniref:Pseudouridine synthase RsuA/RluA-like domain-containing protein n=1 Tax=Papaver nudicaule TaxID=74823 RepID=A0AA42AVK3_PAPNU|nr:hypothetical protein [Papaver nudicaule]